MWESDLLQGAVAERLASADDDLATIISGATVTRSDPSAPSLPCGAGDILSGQTFGSAKSSDDQIANDVHNTLATYGLTPSEVRVLRAYEPAVLARVTVEPAAGLAGKFDAI